MSQIDHTFFSRAHKPGFSQLALNKQVNKLCHLTYQETGRSVHFDSIFLLKPPKLPFPFLFCLTLIIVMLSAGSSHIVLDNSESDQLLGSPHLQSSKNCPHHSSSLHITSEDGSLQIHLYGSSFMLLINNFKGGKPLLSSRIEYDLF